VSREPLQRLVDDHLARTFAGGAAIRSARHRIAVGLKPLDESEAPIERKCCNERARREPALCEALGERGHS
jgi:hypothetical protein